MKDGWTGGRKHIKTSQWAKLHPSHWEFSSREIVAVRRARLGVKNEKYAFTVRKNGVRECVWLKTWRGKQTEGSIWMPSHAYGLSQVSALHQPHVFSSIHTHTRTQLHVLCLLAPRGWKIASPLFYVKRVITQVPYSATLHNRPIKGACSQKVRPLDFCMHRWHKRSQRNDLYCWPGGRNGEECVLPRNSPNSCTSFLFPLPLLLRLWSTTRNIRKIASLFSCFSWSRDSLFHSAPLPIFENMFLMQKMLWSLKYINVN